MNSLIQFLNARGNQLLNFAWPVFWQSCLLIALLWALDFMLRRKARAALRYGLWLLLILKLLAPPSLALQTAPSWWLWRPEAAPARPPTHVLLAGGELDPNSTRMAPQPAAPAAPPPVRWTPAATLFLVWLSGAAGLLTLSLARWRKLAREVGRGSPAPAWLDELLAQSRRLAGARRSIGIRLIDRARSPALCGLFRPMILMPRPLADQLSPVQVRSILCHELIHWRRGDVWVNCAQSLLQLAYWWHPLLWLANARIRDLREEAVDEAVMVCLREEAQEYAPALLHVARLALTGSMPSPGLIGILESHGSLRRRVEKLLDFRPPRQVGLTLWAWLCLLAFGAVALPMGEGPARPAAPPESAVAPASLSLPAEAAGQGTPAVAPPASPGPSANHEPQIDIKARFIEVPQDGSGNLGFDWYLGEVRLNGTNGVFATDTSPGWVATVRTANAQGFFPAQAEAINALSPANPPATVNAVLSNPQAQVLLQALQQRKDTQVVSESSVTTLSGRQAQLSILELRTIVTKVNPQALVPPGVSANGTGTNALWLTETLALGPTLDILPTLTPDGQHTRLQLTASLNQFLGYDQPTNTLTVYVNGHPQKVVPPLPRCRTSKVSSTLVLADGQTAILGGLTSETILKLKDKVPGLGDLPVVGSLFRKESQSIIKKHLLILLTPTLIDPNGNPQHPGP